MYIDIDYTFQRKGFMNSLLVLVLKARESILPILWCQLLHIGKGRKLILVQLTGRYVLQYSVTPVVLLREDIKMKNVAQI